ncbi:tRNA (guanosine(46)-N7)-methyltransferase TrmB [Engelhardtia mirabilis]|uniref:tRNA (guanine-N(7)-)-methyltransferase n=1 Tax=Engelhardtia mirabilis TaxID=2528011 RepID=A0A518BP22_9BACT|nr:tRNA (guanine-N(7)-)-methyltransferase [Planctomycetes bacterium Pla133]QDV03052.1 tRNA (guanine-N(7)-)-methyltransferase [Planctomycetes bacterium Pla86]
MRLQRLLDTSPIAVRPEDLAKPIDWAALFEAERPVELEIGSGKGTFLAQEAAARPEVSFFGVEYMGKYAAYMADRLRRGGLLNCRTTSMDATVLVRDHVPSQSLQAVHVYFPDPWPKKRHHKRRLVSAAFLPELERIVAPGGQLRIVTDHPEYAEWVAEVLERATLERIDYQPPASAREGEMVGTNFERKYTVRDGREFHPFALRRPL